MSAEQDHKHETLDAFMGEVAESIKRNWEVQHREFLKSVKAWRTDGSGCIIGVVGDENDPGEQHPRLSAQGV